MGTQIDHNLLRQKHNPEGSPLRNLQLRMLDILRCIDEICQRHNIQYWLSSGSLLGAIRHGEFIPWDDDLDIEMLRDDYIRLVRILPKELPPQYILQTDETDDTYIYLFGKVRDKRSKITEKSIINQTFKHTGVFIDLFFIEPSQRFLAKISAILFNRLCFNLAQKGGLRYRIALVNRKILKSCIFPIFRQIARCASKKVLRHTFGVNFLKERHLDDIFPLQRIVFDGVECNAPANPDGYLTNIYGDYMKIPDVKDIHIVDNQIELW